MIQYESESVLFIGTQFSILYTSMYSPAEAATETVRASERASEWVGGWVVEWWVGSWHPELFSVPFGRAPSTKGGDRRELVRSLARGVKVKV